MPHHDVGPLSAEEMGEAARLLARVFCDQPLARAILRGRPAARRRHLTASMSLHLPVAWRRGWCAAARDEAGRMQGVLVAVPPFRWPLPPPPLAARLRLVLGQGLAATQRQAAVAEALAARRPAGEGWYLSLLGVAPERARRGVGSALLADWLRQVDEEAASAYLETDVPGNLRFYERAGFAATGELEILGVRVFTLERPALRRSAEPAAALRLDPRSP